MLSWLQQRSNDKYRDRVVAIPGVLKLGEARAIFGVLVGAAQYANKYLGIRKAASAKIVFNPSRGFNEGSLQIHIHTHNGAGVAKGSPILLDYGTEFYVTERSGSEALHAAEQAADPVLLRDEAAEHDETAPEEEEAADVAEAEKKRKTEEQLEPENKKTEGG